MLKWRFIAGVKTSIFSIAMFDYLRVISWEEGNVMVIRSKLESLQGKEGVAVGTWFACEVRTRQVLGNMLWCLN